MTGRSRVPRDRWVRRPRVSLAIRGLHDDDESERPGCATDRSVEKPPQVIAQHHSPIGKHGAPEPWGCRGEGGDGFIGALLTQVHVPALQVCICYRVEC